MTMVNPVDHTNDELTEEQLDPQEKQDQEIQRGQLGIPDPQRQRDQLRQEQQDEEQNQ
ncbi:hypothetical protein [Acinetobacter sp. BY419]|uniref:hypothetical protein n=2 Tax=unclassified Acinetobacter TaxID=196816 RepID=UPI001C2485C2|nr:hypothetical protein [Acinetobacter sp. BY419]